MFEVPIFSSLRTRWIICTHDGIATICSCCDYDLIWHGLMCTRVALYVCFCCVLCAPHQSWASIDDQTLLCTVEEGHWQNLQVARSLATCSLIMPPLVKALCLLMWAVRYLQLFTVQKLEELHESGAVPYSDAPTGLCCSVPSEHISLTWSDQTASTSGAAPRLWHLQLLLL